MLTLVFGGSFDPPHLAHLALLKTAADVLKPQKILVIPSYHAPLKQAPIGSAADRAALARLGLVDALPPRWKKITRVDIREARSKRPVYTVETLSALRGPLAFVCGQDSAAQFPRWRDSSRLQSLATWWYGARQAADGRIPGHFHRLPGQYPPLSSTQLRSQLALGEDVGRSLHPDVSTYIRKRGLYGVNLLETLKSSLSPERFEHTRNVATLAQTLALRHGANPDEARLAGLLHDIGRRYSMSALARYARRERLAVPALQQTLAFAPLLLHAYVSEHIARHEFSISNTSVLRAIRRHTLGDRVMSRLDRILYVADACAKDRHYPGVARTRARAMANLDEAFICCVREKLAAALTARAWVHPLTISLWNSLAIR